MRIYRGLVLLAALATISLSFSCVSAPPPSGVSTIRLVGPEDLSRFGNSFATNPYLAPTSFIRSNVDRYFVFEFSLSLRESTRISATAELVDGSGTRIAEALSRQDLVDRRAIYTPDPADAKGKSVLASSYLPDADFKARSGIAIYYLVVIAPKGISDPTFAQAELDIDGQDPIVFKTEVSQRGK